MTTALQEAVTHAFAAGGSLSQADARYVEREVQLRMAQAVADAIDTRRVLVAEAGTGVGKAAALALMKEGYAAVLAGRRKDKLEETAAEGTSSGAKSLVVPTDVGDPAAIKALFAKTKEAFGRLDLVRDISR